jgi:hypothetical protein
VNCPGLINNPDAANRPAGIKPAEREIHRALAPKKKRLVPPGRRSEWCGSASLSLQVSHAPIPQIKRSVHLFRDVARYPTTLL